MIRAFYAHAGKGDEQTVADAAVCRDVMVERLGSDVELVLGRDDHKANFRSSGGWGGWARSIGAGVRVDGTPRYNLLVSPSKIVGRATADMFRAALEVGRPALVFTAGAFAAVTAVTDLDTDDWKAGYRLVTVDNADK